MAQFSGRERRRPVEIVAIEHMSLKVTLVHYLRLGPYLMQGTRLGSLLCGFVREPKLEETQPFA